jgi:DNA-binding CsgD family transcriptional regulator
LLLARKDKKMPSKSSSLRLQDVRAILRIVGECRDLGDDPVAWPHHLLKSVAELIGGTVVNGGYMIGRWGQPAYASAPESWAGEKGFDQDDCAEWIAAFKDDPTFSLGVMRYMEHFRQEDGVVHTRTDLLSDREHEASTEGQLVRLAGLKHMMGCFRLLPGEKDSFRSLCVWRSTAERDFTRRERVLLHEVQAAIVPLVSGPLARCSDPSPADLAPRVRQVLRCLLEGDGDKQIALRLGLARHTVNQYVKTIFRHFRVESRPELLARWIRCAWSKGFSWADE